MRRMMPLLALPFFAALGATPAAAQEMGQTVSITGCLAQEEEEGETELILQHGMMGETMVEEVDLIPGEGVNVAPHVGHTVEVTGVVVADPDEADEQEQGEEDEDSGGLHLRVTAVRHVAASCEGAR